MGQNSSNQLTAQGLWQQDADVSVCNLCSQPFSLFLRRHHCRDCGQIFCDKCTKSRKIVKGYPNPQRVCYVCFTGSIAPSVTPDHESRRSLPGTTPQ